MSVFKKIMFTSFWKNMTHFWTTWHDIKFTKSQIANKSSLCLLRPPFCLQLFRVEVLFNERKHFVLRRNSEFQTLHRKVCIWTSSHFCCQCYTIPNTDLLSGQFINMDFMLHLMAPAAQEDHPDSRFPKQKKPPSEDQTSGAEEAGAGRLHPGNTSRCRPDGVGTSSGTHKYGFSSRLSARYPLVASLCFLMQERSSWNNNILKGVVQLTGIYCPHEASKQPNLSYMKQKLRRALQE